MDRLRKQLQRLLLVLAMLVTSSAAWAEIASGTLKNGSWLITDDGVLEISVNGKMSDYKGSNLITSAPWGRYFRDIKAIDIKEGCTQIGRLAFKGLGLVEWIKAPSVERICELAFEDCGVKGITMCFPNVTYVEDKAFKYGNVGRVFLPSCQTLRYEAFGEAKYLYQVDLGPNIEVIGRMAFYGCPMMWADRDVPNVFISAPNPPSIRTLWERDDGLFAAQIFVGCTLVGLLAVDDFIESDVFKNSNTVSYDTKDMKIDRTKDQHITPFWPKPSRCDGFPIVYVPYEYYDTYEAENDGHLSSAGREKAGTIFIGGIIYDKEKNYLGWWSFNDDNNTLSVYSDSGVKLPDYGEGKEPWNPVLSIAERLDFTGDVVPAKMFSNMANLKDIQLNNVTEIEDLAFANNPNLQTVTGKENMIATVGNSAFANCDNLETVELANSYHIIIVEDKAFYNCQKLKKALVSDGGYIKKVGAQAFQNTALSSFTMDLVVEIGESAFEGCTKLKEAYLTSCSKVGKRAFANSHVYDLRFTSHLSSIGEEAFADIPGIFPKMDIYAEGEPPTLGDLALSGFRSAYTTLHVNNSDSHLYTKSPWNTFTYSAEAFPVKGDGWELSANGILTIKKNMTTTPWMPYMSDIETIIIDNGVTEIADNAFSRQENSVCRLTTVSIPRSLEKIGSRAFENQPRLITIFVNDVKEVGNYAFKGCTSLKRIEFGTRCEQLGDYILDGATSLKELYTSVTSPPQVSYNTFSGAGTQVIQHAPGRKGVAAQKRAIKATVPEQSFIDYMTTTGWDQLQYIDEEHGEVLAVGPISSPDQKTKYGMCVIYEDGYCDISATADVLYACYDGLDHSGKPKDFWYGHAEDIKTVNLHAGPTVLSGTFHDLPNLETVFLPTSIIKLNTHYFDAATGKYNGGVFQNCPKLKSVSLPYVETIDYDCFNGCTALEMINLPKVKSVGGDAFRDCSSLMGVNFTPTEIWTGAFRGCTSLQSIDLSSVTGFIDYRAFEGCTSLKEVTINANEVRTDVFKGCTSLEKITFGNRIRNLYDSFLDGAPLKEIYISCPRAPRAYYSSHDDIVLFRNVDCSQVKCYVPAEFIQVYRDNAQWNKFQLISDPEYDDSEELPVGGFMSRQGMWKIDTDGTYYYEIQGEGAEVPSEIRAWYGDLIKHVVIKDGCTDPVGFGALMPNCTDMVIGKDVTYLGYGVIEMFSDDSNGGWFQTKLKNMYVFAETPPEFYLSYYQVGLDEEWVINDAGTVLHVLNKPGVKEAYEAHEHWSKFPTIVADLEEGIDPFKDLVTIGDVTCAATQEVDVPVKLNSRTDVASLAFTIKVPECMSVTGTTMGSISKTGELSYRVTVNSTGGTALPTGELLSLTLSAGADMLNGDFYRLRLTDVVLTTTGGETINSTDLTTKLTITIPPGAMGDVNNDGIVNVTDVIDIVSHINGKRPSPFRAAYADMNGDGIINSLDVILLQDRIIGK